MTSLPLALLWSPTDPVVYREGSWILIVPRHMADHIFQFAKLSTGYKFLKKERGLLSAALLIPRKSIWPLIPAPFLMLLRAICHGAA